MSRPIAEIRDISIQFPGVKALDSVSFDIYPGECHALVGENGAGKSTMSKILYGVYQHYTGTLYLEGEEIRCKDPLDAQHHGISVVHQELQLVPELSGLENVFLGNFRKTKRNMIDRKKMYEEAWQVLEMLGVSLDLDSPVKRLRTAEQQILQLVRCLVTGSKIIIFDELTAMLQDREIEHVFSLIKKLKQEGFAIMYISHRLDEIFEICDRYTVLCNGKVTGTGEVKDINKQKLISLMIGRSVESMFPEKRSSFGETVLETKHLSTKAFSDVSIRLQKGEIVGLAGLVGAGKSELLHAICGNYPIESGSIQIRGKEMRFKHVKEAVAQGIGLIPDERKALGLVPGFSIIQNISLASMKKIKNNIGFLDWRKDEKLAKTYAEALQVACPSLYQKVEKLSGGNQQKVIFSKWLLADSEILLFDEPTRGIDVGTKSEIYKIIRDLADQGKSIIVVSPELEELTGLCNRVYVMFEGRIIKEISEKHMTPDMIIPYVVGETTHAEEH